MGARAALDPGLEAGGAEGDRAPPEVFADPAAASRAPLDREVEPRERDAALASEQNADAAPERRLDRIAGVEAEGEIRVPPAQPERDAAAEQRRALPLEAGAVGDRGARRCARSEILTGAGPVRVRRAGRRG